MARHQTRKISIETIFTAKDYFEIYRVMAAVSSSLTVFL
jgi:hypothetical protein